MRIIFTISALVVLISGCVNTEGNLKLKGKVIDEFTKEEILGREIIVQALLDDDDKLVPVDAGRFSSDSTGSFVYLLDKVKDARFYKFSIVGDSDYASSIKQISLFQLRKNAKYLFFTINKLTNLTINILKVSEAAHRDTIYLSWESDNVDFRTLYPYKINNYGITDNDFGLIPYFGLRWIGENINSTIKTKVIADKMTLIHWELVSNKKRNITTDTIVCKRDLSHTVIFKY
jgi:hypothetical protein